MCTQVIPTDNGHPLKCQRIPSPYFLSLASHSKLLRVLAQVLSSFGEYQNPKGVETDCLLGVVFSSLLSGLRRGLRRAESMETSSPGFREGPTQVPILSVLPTAVWL